MTVPVAEGLLFATILVTTRMVAFLAVAPPFSSKSIPWKIRGALAFALSLPVIPTAAGQITATDTRTLFEGMALQLAAGYLMGFAVLVFFSAIQAGGELIDLFSNFTMASTIDPISNTQSPIFGRIQQMIATTILFSSGGHLLLVRGALSSFQAIPLHGTDIGAIAEQFVKNLGIFLISAIEIAGPVIVVLFIADLAMGLVSRAVPSLNIFQLNFPVKTALTVSLASAAVAVLPLALEAVVARSLEQFQPIARLLGG